MGIAKRFPGPGLPGRLFHSRGSRARRYGGRAMTSPARYFDLVRGMKDTYNHRLRLVESAQQRGIQPTARLFDKLRRLSR